MLLHLQIISYYKYAHNPYKKESKRGNLVFSPFGDYVQQGAPF